jgi:hypothetical protein
VSATSFIRGYVPDDYPGGCLCSCCHVEFTPGQIIIDRELDLGWPVTTPTCVDCDAASAELYRGHA